MYELYYLLLCTNNKKLNLGQFFSFLHLLSFFFPGPLVGRVMTREVVPYNRQNMETFKFWLFMYVPVLGNLSIKITSKNKLNFLITSILSCLLARRRGRQPKTMLRTRMMAAAMIFSYFTSILSSLKKKRAHKESQRLRNRYIYSILYTDPYHDTTK